MLGHAVRRIERASEAIIRRIIRQLLQIGAGFLSFCSSITLAHEGRKLKFGVTVARLEWNSRNKIKRN